MTLSLPEAMRQALAGNAEIGVTQAQADYARSQIAQARLRPNPRLAVQSEDIRTGSNQAPFQFVNSTEDYVYAGQIIETGGKRARRVDVAKGTTALSELQTKLTERQILTRVSAAYWNAVLSERLQLLTEETLRTFDEDERYISARVQEGVAAESDAIRIRVERDRLRLTALGAKRDREQAIVALFRAMGKSTFPNVRLTTPLEQAVTPRLPPLTEVLAARPEIGIAQQAITTANSNLRLQQALAKPDPEVYAGYKRNSGYDTAYLAMQIDLPLLNRNQGNIGSARAQIQREESNLRLAENSVRADYEAALRYYQDQQRIMEGLPALVAQAQDAERRARAAYREGGLDLLRLLDAERSRIQVETDYSRAQAELQGSLTALQAASGADLVSGMSK